MILKGLKSKGIRSREAEKKRPKGKGSSWQRQWEWQWHILFVRKKHIQHLRASTLWTGNIDLYEKSPYSFGNININTNERVNLGEKEMRPLA